MIEKINSFVFSYLRLTGNVPYSEKPIFAANEDMDVFYVEHENNYGIIINGWFYQIQKDASLQIAEYNTDYTYDENTLDNIRDFIVINGSWVDTEPVDNFKLWFPPGKYSTLVFKYYGIAYYAHW